MKMLLFALTISITQLLLVSPLLVETGKKESYCFYKHVDQEDELHVSYIISGENEEKVNAVLFDPNQQALFQTHDSESHEYKEKVKETGEYRLCFIPQAPNSYYISFEFFSLFEKGHTLDMAKDENIHDMKKDVADITLMFEEMEKNIKFIMDRRNKHTMVINDIGSSIKHISYFKIVVVVLVSLLQVFLIGKFLGGSKKNSVGYSTNGLFEMSGASL